MSSKNSKKNNEDKIVVSCVGNSMNEVTGSCWTVSYPKNDKTRGLIVIECGLPQGEPTIKQQYDTNKKMIENIGKEVIENATVVLVGHSHVDHTSNLPLFNSDNGFKGTILGSKETIEITKELIKDSVYIHKKNVEYLKSKGYKVKQFYTEPQMYDMFEKMRYAEIGKEIIIDDNLTVIFNNNCHVIGSCNITLILKKPNGSVKSIVYTSDLGSTINFKETYYLEEQNIPKKANLFITEATYCDKERQMTKKQVLKEREDLKRTVKEALMNNRRILFPTFAFSRGQLLLTLFYEWFGEEEWFKEIPVVCDGVLINNINRTYLRILKDENKALFQKVMNWNNLKINRDYEGTIATLTKRERGIYICSSGFLENGRVMTYLPYILSSSKDLIVLTGYCGQTNEGSMGYKMLNEDIKVINIDKQVIQKRCQIKAYNTFTSHISHDELLDLFSQLNVDKIIVHHSGKCKEEFIEEAKEYLRNKNKTTQIIGTNKGCYQFVL